MPRFAAIDFETANRYRHSACAVAIVLCNEQEIEHTWTTLIRPPELFFEFTGIHGISASDVREAPTWLDVQDSVQRLLTNVDFLVAHNASFDKSVLNALSRHWSSPGYGGEWRCTVKLARALWNLKPARLPDVCGHLGIPLRHHDATSDAQACAHIVLRAVKEGALRLPEWPAVLSSRKSG